MIRQMSGEEEWLHQEHSKHFMRQRWRQPLGLGPGSAGPLCLFSARLSACHACERGESPWEGTKMPIFNSLSLLQKCVHLIRGKNEEGEDILAWLSERAIWKGCPWEYTFSWLQPEFIWLLDKSSDRGKRAHLWNFCEAEIFTANTVFKYLNFQSSENCC